MLRRHLRRGGIRRRLAVAFVLAAAVSTGALAVGSYALVDHSRYQDWMRRTELDARVDLNLAPGIRFASPSFDPGGFVQDYQQRNVHAVVVFPGGRAASDPNFNPEIPRRVQQLVAAGQLAYTRMSVGGVPYLVIGGKAPGSDGVLYFFFSESTIHHDLRQLAEVMSIGWLVVVGVAGLAGRALARRVLEPVARASEAAGSMAAGRLDTRLAVSGDDEFARWASSFNQMADTLEAKITAISEAEAREKRFTSDVAHELRTPLTALVAEASLLRDHLELLPEPARRPAQLLVGDVGRLRNLVDELMEISRLDAGHEPVEVQAVALRSLLSGILRARGWQTRVDVEGDELTVETDPRRAERILSNLVGNAIEHGAPPVRVMIGRDDRRARTEVADNAPGIAPDHLPRIFGRFYKVDPARSGTGSGLGLAIALENARLLGGDITVDSNPVSGTRFELSLPLRAGTPRGS